jgi:hypothetical protein
MKGNRALKFKKDKNDRRCYHRKKSHKRLKAQDMNLKAPYPKSLEVQENDEW